MRPDESEEVWLSDLMYGRISLLYVNTLIIWMGISIIFSQDNILLNLVYSHEITLHSQLH